MIVFLWHHSINWNDKIEGENALQRTFKMRCLFLCPILEEGRCCMGVGRQFCIGFIWGVAFKGEKNPSLARQVCEPHFHGTSIAFDLYVYPRNRPIAQPMIACSQVTSDGCFLYKEECG